MKHSLKKFISKVGKLYRKYGDGAFMEEIKLAHIFKSKKRK